MADNYYLSDYTGVIIDRSIGIGIEYDPETHDGYPYVKNHNLLWDTDVADKSWVEAGFISKDKEESLGTVQEIWSIEDNPVELLDESGVKISTLTTKGFVGLKDINGSSGNIGTTERTTGTTIEIPYIHFDKFGRAYKAGEGGSGVRTHEITGLAPIDSPNFIGAPTAPTPNGEVDTQITNVKYVAEQIKAIPSPMIFKGTVGEGGTVSDLPTADKEYIGWTYKVISDGEYAGIQAKKGDTFICSSSGEGQYNWVLIPSGDEPSGTVTSVGLEVGTEGGITVKGDSPITESGTFKVSHANTSSASSVNITDANKWINKISIDKFGHITEIGSGALDTSGVWTGKLSKKVSFTSVAEGSAVSGAEYDGSGNVVVSYKTIGAAPLVHTHKKEDITDFAHTHLKKDITDFEHTHLKKDITDFEHTHLKKDITDFAHTHTKEEITNFAHTHVKADITDFAHKHIKEDITDFTHTHGTINYDGTITASKAISGDESFAIIDTDGNIKKSTLTFGTEDENKFLSSTGQWKVVSVDNFYHSTGSWDGKTYKALNSSDLTPNLWVTFSHDKQTEIVLKDDFYVDDEGVLIINTEVH